MRQTRKDVGQAVVLAASLALISEIFDRQARGAEAAAQRPGVEQRPAVEARPASPPPGRAARPGEMSLRAPARRAAAAQPFRQIEGQLAYVESELRVTEAQRPQWDAFVAAARLNAHRLREADTRTTDGRRIPAAPEMLERRAAMLAAQLEATQRIAEAAGPLYAVLSEAQKRTADVLMWDDPQEMRLRWM